MNGYLVVICLAVTFLAAAGLGYWAGHYDGWLDRDKQEKQK